MLLPVFSLTHTNAVPRCDVLAESSTRRGAGLAVKARCPLHVNVTAALLDTLSDMQQQMALIFAELDAENFRRRVEALRAAQTATGAGSDGYQPSSAIGGGKDREDASAGGQDETQGSAISRYRHREVVQYDDVFYTPWPADDGGGDGGDASKGDQRGAMGVVNTPRFPVCHEFCAPLPLESRMSFTILNLTGQRARYFQPRAGEETRRLQYLRVRNCFCSYLPLEFLFPPRSNVVYPLCEGCLGRQSGWMHAGSTGASVELSARDGDCPCRFSSFDANHLESKTALLA